jgi:choline dehydrogenase
MLSGVGPADHLRSFGITLVHDQPGVGQGMADNPMNGIYVPSPSPVEISLIQVVGITQVGSYIEGSSGARHSASPRNFGMFSPQVKVLLPRDVDDASLNLKSVLSCSAAF